MKSLKTLKLIAAVLLIVTVTGCATKTVVVPSHQHAHHVIYKVKPAKAHCWRHRGHWDCRKS
ncbi:MAG: hypothetical protein R3192_17210 [Woeseiaceae bacterium]|nr:hypothetical protein [Woeseiaceae bacterium]